MSPVEKPIMTTRANPTQPRPNQGSGPPGHTVKGLTPTVQSLCYLLIFYEKLIGFCLILATTRNKQVHVNIQQYQTKNLAHLKPTDITTHIPKPCLITQYTLCLCSSSNPHEHMHGYLINTSITLNMNTYVYTIV